VAHHELLVLVARVHDDLFRFVALQHVADELVPERAGAAGHEHGLAIKHGLSFSLWGFQSANIPQRYKRRKDLSKGLHLANAQLAERRTSTYVLLRKASFSAMHARSAAPASRNSLAPP